MSEPALQLIREAKEKRATFLDLGNCGLTELPDELFELEWLEELNFGTYFFNLHAQKFLRSKNDYKNNAIKTIPKKILNLKELKTLCLFGNNITDISVLKGLTNLTLLYLYKNNITDISAFKALTNLTFLYLSNNIITDISVLKELANLTNLDLSINDIIDISILKELTNLTMLGLSENNILDFSVLKGFTNLTKLYLSNNNITDISVLKELTNLTTLDLSRNNFTDISVLKALTNLTTLNLRNNNITDISVLKALTNLTTLDLYSNNITDVSILKELTNLTTLNLSNNRITDISILKGLNHLTTLYLSYNNITDISPIKSLIEKGIPIKWEDDHSGGIILKDNPLTTPPPEVVQQGNEAVLNYFKELEEQGSELLYEAKLLIIGEGGAGKTTLARKIKDVNAPMPEEKDTTKGITVEPYSFQTASGKSFQVNIWDFGGQEIYHTTHQFFLTKRSLYILVDDTRKDDKTVHDASFNFWLPVVSLFGDNSPLLIVQNEKADRTKALDMASIKGRFDFVISQQGTNLLTGRGLAEVRDAIHYHIQQLPHVGEKHPKKWLAVRKALKELAKTKDFIYLEEYLSICTNHGITEEERALRLSSYLHDLGMFLHFQDGSVLQNIFILNNQWATDAVYKVLDNETVKKASGRFNHADLNIIWCEAKYKHRHNELLALMMKFELCYEIKDTAETTWLAPQLLPVEAPPLHWDSANQLIVRYTFDFMPKGLLSRFIVRKHPYINDATLSWRSGVVLERQHTSALVTETYGSREIVVKVKGLHPIEFMTIITEDFDQMHAKFGNLKVKKLIPCNCTKCLAMDEPNFYEYDDLVTRKEKGKRTIECKLSYDAVDVTGLLDGVFTNVKGEKDDSVNNASNNALNVFLSYSHEDEALKEQLDKALSALKHSDKIKPWNDRKISGGDEWDETIKRELDKADIILLLISADFMNSKYIWEVEIKMAIERHNKKEAKVIPVFLRPCDFEGMPFEKLQGYPTNTKPVTSFTNQDEAFTQIAKGIRRDIAAWKKRL